MTLILSKANRLRKKSKSNIQDFDGQTISTVIVIYINIIEHRWRPTNLYAASSSHGVSPRITARACHRVTRAEKRANNINAFS